MDSSNATLTQALPKKNYLGRARQSTFTDTRKCSAFTVSAVKTKCAACLFSMITIKCTTYTFLLNKNVLLVYFP